MQAASELRDSAIADEWAQQQLLLREKLIKEDDLPGWNADTLDGLKYIGGVDISFVKESNEDAAAALVVLEYPSMKVVYESVKSIKLLLPYIPGFLAFRESPFLEDLLTEMETEKPEVKPQVIFVDGNGMLHSRLFGLACHLGVVKNYCTIGVGKNLFHVDGLTHEVTRAEAAERLKSAGDWMELKGETQGVLGAALRSTDGAFRPIYVSIGHRISLQTAVRLVSRCCPFRVPEPIRQADQRSRVYVREKMTPPPLLPSHPGQTKKQQQQQQHHHDEEEREE